MSSSEAPSTSWPARYRSYLLLLARLQLKDQAVPRVEASDVVQQALLEAMSAVEQFRGSTEGERVGWLRQILAHTLADHFRHQTRGKRDVRRERSIEDAVNASSSRLGNWLITEEPTPSHVMMEHEQAVALTDALATLPAAQQEALILQHWYGWSLAQIGEYLDKTPAAVAGLLKRGLQALREKMSRGSGVR